MRYERPVIEERIDVRALLGNGQISGGAGDIAIQPIWRPARSDHGLDDTADR